MKLLIASNNQHKYNELTPPFHLIGIDCVLPMQLGLSLPHEVESYPTYRENAKAKVSYLLNPRVDAILADDSGLEVTALDGQPGIQSARYAGTGNEEDNRQFLLKKMLSVPMEKRDARFICVLCLWWHNQYYFFEGSVNGFILEKEIGFQGFGYDPLFYIPSLKKTFSQLPPETKMVLSHRGKALEKCVKFLRKSLHTEGGS